MKVAVAGNILLDIVKLIDVWPEKGMLVNIQEEHRAVGGCVCNTAIDLKVLVPEIDVIAYGRVGEDEYGKWVLNCMEAKDLDVTNVVKTVTQPTSYTDVMTVQATGERTFFHARGANKEFSEADIDLNRLDCDLFHLGYLLLLDSLDKEDTQYGTKAAKLLHAVQQKGIKTSIDLVSDQSGRFSKVVPPALKYCDYAVMNEIEGGMLAGISPRKESGDLDIVNLEKICQKLLGMGIKDAVVIHCSELSCSLERNGKFVIVPSLELPNGYIVGSVGAGDAFCAGMLYAFVSKMEMKAGMELASCVAACNLSVATSIDGARNLEETLKLEKIYQRRNIQC